MTESEAIKILKKDSCYECSQGTDSPLNCEYVECRVAKATRVAIKALEEVQQYRAIGTIEECRAAVERQNPRAAITEKEDNGIKKYTCYACGRYMGWSTGTLPARYCWKCGQKLDWGDEE